MEHRSRALLIAFWLVQIAFVTATGLLLSYGEGERYRYQIEPFLWILAALGITTLWRRAEAAWAKRRPRRPGLPCPPTSRSLP